jgi:DNA-binding GntR family transcriptional regulator
MKASFDNTVSANEKVRQEILARLRAGTLSPGQQIVAAELADELKISRVPVREALHVLAGEGIIDLSKNKSARVRAITDKDIVDMLRLLAAVGGLSLQLAGEKMDDPNSASRITEAMDSIINGIRKYSVRHFYNAAHQFHVTLNDIADNFFLSKAFESLHMDYFNRALSTRLPGEHWKVFEMNYIAIRDALKANNPAKASTLYQSHMLWAVSAVHAEESAPLVGNQ